MIIKNKIIILLLLFAEVFLFSNLSYAQNNANQNGDAEIEKVAGIGGWFIRSDDPAKLSQWHETHLGINFTPESYEAEVWEQKQGPAVFAPSPNDTEYFGRENQSWMINFRVNDLDAMVRQLEEAGIEVTIDEQEYPNGRFARLYDPEGNPIELWEPKTNN